MSGCLYLAGTHYLERHWDEVEVQELCRHPQRIVRCKTLHILRLDLVLDLCGALSLQYEYARHEDWDEGGREDELVGGEPEGGRAVSGGLWWRQLGVHVHRGVGAE